VEVADALNFPLLCTNEDGKCAIELLLPSLFEHRPGMPIVRFGVLVCEVIELIPKHWSHRFTFNKIQDGVLSLFTACQFFRRERQSRGGHTEYKNAGDTSTNRSTIGAKEESEGGACETDQGG